jgi:alcohol dehydrogenase class IV
VTCRHIAALSAGCDSAFTVDASRVTFGRGALVEVGDRARALGMKRAALVTDRRLRALPWFFEVAKSLSEAGIETIVFDEVEVEPTDASFDAAARFARDARADGYISLGGGSVIDTCKAANLLATYPAPLATYVNAPLGDARAVPGPLAPHIACPTTSGTGSEVTGIAIFDWLAHHAKTGIASAKLRPSEAIVDPRTTATLPAMVVAASGMDVVCHAVESYTARRFTQRPAPAQPSARPMSQGANPWSDLGCRDAMRLANTYLVRAVNDASDDEAREQIMWAATLAGIAFGNAGVHVPHAMAYAIAGRVKTYAPPGYPTTPIVPHGIAVAVAAPSVFSKLGAHGPERHLEAAALLGADARGADVRDGGPLLAARVVELSRAIAVPDGIGGVGYTAADVDDLIAGTLPQQRLLANAPCEVDASCLRDLFTDALRYA